MTRGACTGFASYTQVGGIHKTNKLPTLAGQQAVSSFRVRSSVATIASPLGRKQCLHVGQFLDTLNFFWVVAGFERKWITTVTCGATQANRILAVFKFFECVGGAVFVHRLNLTVT